MEALILRYYLKVFSFTLFFLIFILIFYCYYLINKNITPKNYLINISKSQTFSSVLHDNFSLNFFQFQVYKIYYKINLLFNFQGIHFGDFYIKDKTTIINLINTISKPSNILNKITIIEGWTKSQLNKELSKYFNNYYSIEYNEILADTYYFQNNNDFEQFLTKLKNFKKKYIENLKGNIFFNNFDDNDLLIIGSLIEKEGLDYIDKKNISSVIFNRLNKKMKLQIDATVIYSITKGEFNLDRGLRYKDLKIDHPFNTYLIYGLPPEPISYVGTKTVDIIMQNYKSDFLFYFYNNEQKKHIFSKNYDDHKEKLNDYREKQ